MQTTKWCLIHHIGAVQVKLFRVIPHLDNFKHITHKSLRSSQTDLMGLLMRHGGKDTCHGGGVCAEMLNPA